MSEPSPPPPDEPVPSPPGDLEAGSCPRCGSRYAPGQEYCLACGLRLPVVRGFVAAQLVPSLGRVWRRRVGPYPGDWIWPVVFGLVVAAIGATAAILATQNNGGSKTIVATQPTQTTGGTTTAPPTGTTSTGTTPTATTPTETTPTETTPTETTPTETTPSGPVKWPAGKAGFTVVLASIAQSDGIAAARKTAEKALGAGLSGVGILNSSNFSSLNGGYYVVFSGVYDTLAEAESNLSTAKPTFPQAYTRKISP